MDEKVDNMTKDLIVQMSEGDNQVKGLITLGISKKRMLRRQPIDKYEEYVSTFSKQKPVNND